MSHLVRSKPFIGFLIVSFVLFITPTLRAQVMQNTGSLIGFVYAADGTTPVEGAVFKVKNVKTNKVYESSKSDALGVFKIDSLEEGLYLAGVNSGDHAYIIQNVLGVKANTTAKLSLSLKTDQTVQLPAGPEGTNQFIFLGLTGAAAIFSLAAILAALGLGLAALFGAFEGEASPYKK